jgi:hydroxymethylpyrimidine/phosphomethylpyrimidine kinase
VSFITTSADEMAVSVFAPIACTIAGSDSGAGAGIQADLKTFSALGCFGATVVTLITAQNTSGVTAITLLDSALITAQLEAVFGDFRVAAVKTGALGSAGIIETVASYLAGQDAPLIIDPVMISKHGHALLPIDAIGTLKTRLFPLATVVTPNLFEAAALTGVAAIETSAEMERAARAILELGPQAVIIKGGHSEGDPVDLLVDASGSQWLRGVRIDSPHLHGTGCTFSAAITAGLTLGLDLGAATRMAKDYVSGAIRCGIVFGRGINPVNHFWRTEPQFGDCCLLAGSAAGKV